MKTREILLRVHWLLSTQFGLDPIKLIRSLRGLPRYVRDFFTFRSSYTGPIAFAPCLYDWDEEGASIRNEYFWQDLLVARQIFEAKPERHVDVGSRVDGFVAHVAAFREVEVLDVRPITSKIPGILFTQADLMDPPKGMIAYCDSLSCLHALEHFGLGRYGDPVDPQGFARGLASMAELLRENGTFYLSVPIGIPRVEFNANRVLDPEFIIKLATENLLVLSALTIITDGQDVELRAMNNLRLSDLAAQRYALGIFTFTKSRAHG